MTANPIKLLDVVALTVDLPDYNLWRRQVGTVVEILADGKAFETEKYNNVLIRKNARMQTRVEYTVKPLD